MFLLEKLDELVYAYDYGIVPGSATIFVRDKIHNVARMDLTLLEDIMVVIEISSEGYRALSCSPLSNAVNMSSVNLVQKHMEMLFESMDNLLIKISPMFKERFQIILDENLKHVHKHLQTDVLQDFDQWIH
ncbi:hypothetical protein G6F56_010975 [Rhizopus delemar]|nr:hypothetical protein G6F56_010975 [Rhizopus delemar]